jgi:hypothetical protein
MCACQAHNGIRWSVPGNVPKRGPRTIHGQPTPHQPPESRMSRIARRAHEIYEARGGEHGQAEREIDAELSAGPGIDR